MKNKTVQVTGYWALGGLILGAIELLIGLPLYSWLMPQIKMFLWGPLLYAAVFGFIGLIFSAIFQNKEISWKTAANIGFIIFVWGLIWTTHVFKLPALFAKNKLIIISNIVAIAGIALFFGKLAYKFLCAQNSKANLGAAFSGLSFGLYSALAASMYIYRKFCGGSGLKYLFLSLAASIALGIAVFYFTKYFLKRFGLIITAASGILLLTGVFFILPGFAGKEKNPPQEKIDITLSKQDMPNIILISPDTLRADHLSCYGYPRIKTPAIDSLAREGVIFKDASTAASWTVPSFGSILSSIYPSIHGASRTLFSLGKINDEVPLLSEILRQAGYKTSAIINNVALYKKYGFGRGFDDFYTLGSNIIPPDETARSVNSYYLLREQRKAFLWAWLLPDDPPARAVNDASGHISQKALDWIDNNHKNKFFLWLHYYDPHAPYERVKTYGLDPAYKGKLSDYELVRKFRRPDVRRGIFQLDSKDKEFMRTLYDEEILYLDENIGKILNKLKELGLEDNTVIIFCSDHGEEFWEHGLLGHGQGLFEEVLRVPLIIKFPKRLPAAHVIDSRVSLLDIMPTVLDLAGIGHNLNLNGKSLLPLISNDEAGDRIIFSESLLFYEERKSIKSGKNKLIYFPASEEMELYDLEKDPLEKNNIAEIDQKTALSLKTQIVEWQNICRQRREGFKSGSDLEIDSDTKARLMSLGYLQ